MAEFESSTHTVPVTGPVPRHIAIIMDGNGRWAHRRHLPRLAGHQRGVEAVRRTVVECLEQGVEYLTLFAFSTENWRRPAEEVSFLQRRCTDTLWPDFDAKALQLAIRWCRQRERRFGRTSEQLRSAGGVVQR